jgi:hypothetical protein
MSLNPILPGTRCGCWPLLVFDPGPPGLTDGYWIGVGIFSVSLEEWFIRSRIGTRVWFWSDEGPDRSRGTDTVLVLTVCQSRSSGRCGV